jgi:hypothetical protein
MELRFVKFRMSSLFWLICWNGHNSECCGCEGCFTKTSLTSTAFRIMSKLSIAACIGDPTIGTPPTIVDTTERAKLAPLGTWRPDELEEDWMELLMETARCDWSFALGETIVDIGSDLETKVRIGWSGPPRTVFLGMSAFLHTDVRLETPNCNVSGQIKFELQDHCWSRLDAVKLLGKWICGSNGRGRELRPYWQSCANSAIRSRWPIQIFGLVP